MYLKKSSVCVCSLFNDDFSVSQTIQRLNEELMSDGLERQWKEAVVA
jgi:hypothetical protein